MLPGFGVERGIQHGIQIADDHPCKAFTDEHIIDIEASSGKGTLLCQMRRTFGRLPIGVRSNDLICCLIF
jgi:hypothetical protein